MAKKRTISHLACGECKRRNYTQVVSKKRTIGSLVLRKFCAFCRKHYEHRETK
ncbi:MAG: 50S ribosomal protein L33 [Candidatus Babeliales bacterium]